MSKKVFTNKWVLFSLISVLLITVFTLLILLFSENYKPKGIVDSISFAGILSFVIGWFILISTGGIFDFTIYGVKSFWSSILGKTMEKTYIEYHQEHKVAPKHTYIPFIVIGLIAVIAAWASFYIFNLG